MWTWIKAKPWSHHGWYDSDKQKSTPSRTWYISHAHPYADISEDKERFRFISTGIPVTCVVQPSNCDRFVPINIALLEKYHGKCLPFYWTKFCNWQMTIIWVRLKIRGIQKAALERVSLNQISMKPVDLRWFQGSQILMHTYILWSDPPSNTGK